jgi:hypothetical protein
LKIKKTVYLLLYTEKEALKLIDIPLKILIIDPDHHSSDRLRKALLSSNLSVISVEDVDSLKVASTKTNNNEINCIFIDNISFGLEKASEYIFDTRKAYSNIVFVLYIDFNEMDQHLPSFYAAERERYRHYYKLDKNTPLDLFVGSVEKIVQTCQRYLGKDLSTERIQKLQIELSSLRNETKTDSVIVPIAILKNIQNQLDSLKQSIENPKRNDEIITKPKSVFLSHKFAEKEYVGGLRKLLEKEGFTVVTGEHAKSYISEAILERIKACEFFLCLMTCVDKKTDGTYTTSPWILEEKGVAIALGKNIVLMVEDGINDIGGLQGDWQIIRFRSKSFTIAAIQAITQIKSLGNYS